MPAPNGYLVDASGAVTTFPPVTLEPLVPPCPACDDPGSAMAVSEYGRGTVRHAIAGYDAYGSEARWKTWDNKPMPSWVELGIKVQRRWCAATVAIIGSERGYDTEE